MNTSSSAPNLQNNNHKIRFGLMKVYIGTDHVVKCPDGIKRQFRVRDKSRYPRIDTKCVCMTCGKVYDDEETLLADHPENRVMAKQQEKHVYGWWSDKSLSAPDVIDAKEDKKVVKINKYTDIIGLLSDEEMPQS